MDKKQNPNSRKILNGCLCILVIVVSIPIVILCWNGIKPVFQENREMYNEEIFESTKDRYVHIIHNINCPNYSSWFGRNHKMSFIKKRYQIFCPQCIKMEEAILLNTISRYNIDETEYYSKHPDEVPKDVSLDDDCINWDRTDRKFAPVFVIGPRGCVQVSNQDRDEINKHIGNSEEKEIALVPVWGENIYSKGYINDSGRFIIEPQFDDAGYFYEGLAPVKIGGEKGKWGFINTEGKFVINPQFDRVGSFSEGLASVEVDGNWGYINKAGEFVINPQFCRAYPFTEGLAAVDQLFGGFINKEAQFVIEPQFCDVCPFSDGLARVLPMQGPDKYGYVNHEGKMVIEPKFDISADFSEGLALVKVDEKWGFINTEGKFVINLQFDRADSFSEGLASVAVGNKWGYINKAGEFVINPQFDRAYSFSEGLAVVLIGDHRNGGKYGVINKDGKFIINPQYEWIDGFHEGLSKVEILNSKKRRTIRTGYINKKGEFVYWEQRKF